MKLGRADHLDTFVTIKPSFRKSRDSNICIQTTLEIKKKLQSKKKKKNSFRPLNDFLGSWSVSLDDILFFFVCTAESNSLFSGANLPSGAARSHFNESYQAASYTPLFLFPTPGLRPSAKSELLLKSCSSLQPSNAQSSAQQLGAWTYIASQLQLFSLFVRGGGRRALCIELLSHYALWQ